MRHIAIALLLVCSVGRAEAALLEFKGKLTDSAQQPLTGTFLVTFKLLDAIDNGNGEWEESRYVRAVDGNFSAVLGDKKAIPKRMRTHGYRMKFETLLATGWNISMVEPPRWLGAPETPPTQTDPTQAAQTSAFPMEHPDSAREAERARVEVEKYKKRLEALEKVIEKNAESKTPRANIYVVKHNDTLRSIAQKLFGNAVHWIDIYRANSDRIRRGGELVPGQKLLIPKIYQ